MSKKEKKAQKKIEKKKAQLLEVSDTCINCNEHIALDQRFCSHCGGKRIYNRITWRNLIADFFDRFLNLENSFFKTFITMFRQPEDVIGGYMNGMRKKYLPAFNYFAIAISFTGLYYFLLKGWFLEDFVALQMQSLDSSMSQEQIEMRSSITNWFIENQTLYMILLIPFFAILSKIVFWNHKKYNLVEHFVIFLYTYSHISIVSVIVQISVIWSPQILTYVGFGISFLLFFFSLYVLKRLFKLDLASTILKTLLFFVVISVLSCFLMTPMIIYGVKVGIDKSNGKEIDDSSVFGKFIKSSIDQDNARRKAAKEKDSIYNDSIKRLEDTLEITPEMIKNESE